MKKTALISVSDKNGIVEFAQELSELGWKIISTGGTYKLLAENSIENLSEISDFTNFPEGLEGRIKTLTPQVFGGILNLRNNESHQKFCQENSLENIDMVVVNLYPFKENYCDKNKNFVQKVEQIDIGGPSMIRAAAKNYEFCCPVVNPDDYKEIIKELKVSREISLNFKKELATKVFEMTAHYDLLIAKFWAENARTTPEEGALRYGENPHQSAVLLNDPFSDGANLVQSKILNGKPLSYNNFGDANGALELANSFSEPFACIIKHASPCCAAIGDDIFDAFSGACEHGDMKSAFGGIIALNKKVDQKTAEKIVSFFNEVILAPDYDEEALKILQTKKNLRVLQVPNFDKKTIDWSYKKIAGGTLMQDLDLEMPDFSNLKFPTKNKISQEKIADLKLAWSIVKSVKSNAIVVVKNGALISANGGQTSRVEAMENALRKGGENARGAVLASDAFFPFADSIDLAGKFGISEIIQPGGSIRDEEVISKADELGIAMAFTNLRSFLH